MNLYHMKKRWNQKKKANIENSNNFKKKEQLKEDNKRFPGDGLPLVGTERGFSHQREVTSFLDGLSEEDRRTRTRHLPSVDGIRKLYKSEIKHDLKLVRSLMQRKQWEKKEDEKNSTDTQSDEPSCNGPFLIKESEKEDFREDLQVQQSISAFNPPRPPESVGPKKKHRLMRWERNPDEIEIDLENYKKTVDKTRMELHKTEEEYRKIEAIMLVLKQHFMNQSEALKEETLALKEELKSFKITQILLELKKLKSNRKKIVDGEEVVTKYGKGVVLNVLDEESIGIPSRICVQLKFGIGYFMPDFVCNHGTFSEKGSLRNWNEKLKIIKNAQCVDLNINKMRNIFLKPKQSIYTYTPYYNGDEYLKQDESVESECAETVNTDRRKKATNEVRLLPFDNNLLPSSTNRGGSLAWQSPKKKFPSNDFFRVLALNDTKDIPAQVKSWEDERYELFKLKAHVLQLRNDLKSQKKIRIINERSFSLVEKRSSKTACLVIEMLEDLKKLKKKLANELVELGVDQEKANSILKEYYQENSLSNFHCSKKRSTNEVSKDIDSTLSASKKYKRQ